MKIPFTSTTYSQAASIKYDAVICDINLKVPPLTNQPRSVYLYNNANMTGLQEHLRGAFHHFKLQTLS